MTNDTQTNLTELAPPDFDAAVQEALEAAEDQDSHTERDAATFHPSQLARCDRRAYCSKLGLDDHSDILGVFQTGTLIHEFLEEHLALDREAEFETALTETVDGITLTGRADVIDRAAEAVYDFKTRANWYNFDPPVQRHLDQVMLYMVMAGVDRGQIVYLSKSDMEVRTYPEDGYFHLDHDRVDQLLRRAKRIQSAIAEEGFAKTAAEIPFEKCDCWFCSQETLAIPAGEDDE